MITHSIIFIHQKRLFFLGSFRSKLIWKQNARVAIKNISGASRDPWSAWIYVSSVPRKMCTLLITDNRLRNTLLFLSCLSFSPNFTIHLLNDYLGYCLYSILLFDYCVICAGKLNVTRIISRTQNIKTQTLISIYSLNLVKRTCLIVILQQFIK